MAYLPRKEDDVSVVVVVVVVVTLLSANSVDAGMISSFSTTGSYGLWRGGMLSDFVVVVVVVSYDSKEVAATTAA